MLLLGTNLWHSERLIEMALKYVQGALVPDAFYSDSNKEQVVDFINRYENAFQEKPKFIEAVAYDTAMILFQTVNQAEIKSQRELKDRLKAIRDYDGVTGLTSFKTNGEVDKKLYLFRKNMNEKPSSKTGLAMIRSAFLYSLNGLCFAIKNEVAFCQEVGVFVVLLIVLFFLPISILFNTSIIKH